MAVVLDQFLPVTLSIAEQRHMASLIGHSGYITSLKYNHSGNELISTSWDNTARIWNPSSGELLAVLEDHDDTVNVAAFSADDKLVATGASDGFARIWERSTSQLQLKIPHEAPVQACTFSPDGTLLATSSVGGTISIWDISKDSEIARRKEQLNRISELTFSSDGGRLVFPLNATTLGMWNTELGLRLPNVQFPGESGSNWVRFNESDDSFVSQTVDGQLRRFSPAVLVDHLSSTDHASITSALNKLRAAKQTRTTKESNPIPIEALLVFLPSDSIGHFINEIRSLAPSDNVSPAGGWTLNAELTKYYPLHLLEGDCITAIEGITPDAFYDPANQENLKRVEAGTIPLNLDILRQSQVLRYRLFGIPVVHTEESVTLTTAQATAMLTEALEMLRNSATTLLEVTQDRTIPGRDPRIGLQIPELRHIAGKSLVKASGLQSLSRLVAINDTPVEGLDGMEELLQQALGRLQDNGPFEARFRLERGVFTTANHIVHIP